MSEAEMSPGDASAAEPLRRELRGVVERITFQNPENGYTIARLAPERPSGEARVVREQAGDYLVTLVGTLADLSPGEAIVAHGWWKNDAKYGWQFVAADYRTTLPATVQGMKKYLGSGLVKGVGPVNAGRIVDVFGDSTFEIIDTAPQRLREVPGIGPVRAQRIAAAWDEQRHIREVMASLQSYGCSTSLAVRIYKRFGDDSGRVIQREPYRLAREVWGIGFKTADKIAQAVGIAPDAPERLQAGVLHALATASDEGHTLLPLDRLLDQASALLAAGDAAVQAAVHALLESGDLVAAHPTEATGAPDTIGGAASGHTAGRPQRQEPAAEPNAEGGVAGVSPAALMALAPFARAESGLAGRLRALQAAGKRAERTPSIKLFGGVDWPVAFRWLEERHRLTLAPEQAAAVQMALTSPVSLLTGGPGTGKTHSLKATLTLARVKRLRCVLAAPTGRAAKRMEEATGLPAGTLHRVLELRPGGKAGRNADRPLEADLVVVDETSMLDALLANQLAKAIAPGTHLLLVGDPDQLPSVGAGDVLADLLRSAQFPVTRLTHIFRQGAGSGIAQNARRINAGEVPVFGRDVQDCFFLPAETPQQAGQLVIDLVARRLPARYGFQRGEVQVLAPMHRGDAGVGVLNNLLQERLNPHRDNVPEVRGGGRTYRPGDRVLQLKNDYDLEVFNGDLGTVKTVDPVEQQLVLTLDDGREIDYPAASLYQLTHSHAMTVHKCVAHYERVHTANRGLVRIEQVRRGDVVYTSEHVPRKVLNAIPTGERPVVRIITHLGYQLDVSHEHPVLIGDDAPPRFVEAGKIVPGQFACLSRHVVESGYSVPLPECVARRNEIPFKVPVVLDSDLAWWLGATVGDGSYRDQRDGTIDLTNQDEEVLVNWGQMVERVGLRVGVYRHPMRRATRLYVVSAPFRRWLCAMGLDYVTGPAKLVPDCIFSASAAIRAAFLRGLFDTDGTAGKGKTRSCRLVTSSFGLARDVQALLLSLGIVSYISRVTERAWCVGVSGTALGAFASRIGFTVRYKQDRLEHALATSTAERTNVDSIPFGRMVVDQLVKELRTRWGPTRGRLGEGLFAGFEANRATPRARMTAACRGVRTGNGLTYARAADLRSGMEDASAPVPQLLADLERTRYFYDRIVSVQHIGRVARMYDLEVEGVHDFVANGFVCHNSQGAEFPAVVIPLLTSHAAMLGRTLLYTAVTRARQLVVIVGQQKALRLAVNDWRRESRHTALGGLLDGSLRFAWRSARAAEAAEDLAEDAWEGLVAAGPES